jgi:hypothetical protein
MEKTGMNIGNLSIALAMLLLPGLCSACQKPEWVSNPDILASDCYFVGIGKGKT